MTDNIDPTNLATPVADEKIEAREDAVIDWLHLQSQKSYESEVERTQKLRDRLQFYSGTLLTPILGAYIYLATTYQPGSSNCLNVLFYLAMAGTAALIVTAIIWIGRYFLISDKFAFEVAPRVLWSQYDQLRQAGSKRRLRDLKYNASKSLSDAHWQRAQRNQEKLGAILAAQKFTFFALLPLIAAAVLYFVGRDHQPAVTRIQWIPSATAEISHGGK